MVNARYAYCGLVDDFAIRNKDGLTIQTLDELNDHLIRAVLMGDRIIINDGHVLLNPAIQQAILRPDESPFRSLFKSEFIMIASRNGGDLPGLCAYMAEDKITTAQTLLASSFYTEQYEGALQNWSKHLNSLDANWSRSWPAHKTDFIYGKLSSRVLEELIEANNEDEELTRFKEALGNSVTSRTAWENTADSLHNQGQLSQEKKASLMAAANEAYQYAWGCNLNDKNHPTSVQTRASRFLDDLNRPVGNAPIESRPDEVRVFVPNVEVAGKGIRTDWKRLAEVASRSSPAAEAKSKFREDLDKYYSGTGITDKEMKASAKAYSKSLAAMFGQEEKAKTAVDLAFAAVGVGAAIGAFTAFLPAGLAGLAIAGGIAVAGGGLPHTKPGRNLVSRLGQTKPSKWISEVQKDGLDPRVCISSFELDPEKAAECVKDAPLYKRK